MEKTETELAAQVVIKMTGHGRGSVTIDGVQQNDVKSFRLSAGVNEKTRLTIVRGHDVVDVDALQVIVDRDQESPGCEPPAFLAAAVAELRKADIAELRRLLLKSKCHNPNVVSKATHPPDCPWCAERKAALEGADE